MLITQHSYWTPRSLKDLFQLCPSGILWFLQISQAHRENRRSSRWARGGWGDRSASLPHPQTQPGVCSRTPTTWPFHQPWQDSPSQWETVLSSSLPGAAKSDKAWGPPQGLAWLPPTSWEAVASQAAPGSSKIGSALQQLTLTAWPAPPLAAHGSQAPTPHTCTGGHAPLSLPSCSHGWPRPLPSCLYS